MNKGMEHTDLMGLFRWYIAGLQCPAAYGRVIHILCSGGNMGFTFQDTRYHIAAGDYVILPMQHLGRTFGLRGLPRHFYEPFGFVYYLNSHSQQLRHHRTFVTFAESGHETSFHDFRVCKQAMLCIRERMEDKGHLFREELLGSLLTAIFSISTTSMHADRRRSDCRNI